MGVINRKEQIKLAFLHECLIKDTEQLILDKSLNDYQDEFNNYKIIVVKKFDPNNTEHVNALCNFRDALLKSE